MQKYYYSLPISNKINHIVIEEFPNLNIKYKRFMIKNENIRIILEINKQIIILHSNGTNVPCLTIEDSNYCFEFIKKLSNAVIFSITTQSLFPTGITEVDMITMLNVPDNKLNSFCAINTELNAICDSQEFWRLKLSKLMNYELDHIDINILNYKKAYHNLKKAVDDGLRPHYERNRIKPLDSMLIASAKYGYTYLAQVLIDIKEVNVNIEESIALYWAIYYKDIKMVKLLLSRGANILNTRDENYLFYASERCSVEIAKLLLDAISPKEAEYMNSEYTSSLQMAVHKGCAEVVKLLISRGADVTEFNNAALYEAINDGNIDIIKILIDPFITNGRPADIHARNNKFLRMAAEEGYTKIVELFLSKGTYTVDDYNIILFSAANCGHIEMVEWLFNKNIPIDIHAEDDLALRAAAQGKHREIVELLISKGANVNTAIQSAENSNTVDFLRNYLDE